MITQSLQLSTPITFSNNDDFVRATIGNYSGWMPCVICDEDLPRLRDWLNETIALRACAVYAGI